jgi:prepilin-type N-terminal cleavage/methylation domain-containing protein
MLRKTEKGFTLIELMIVVAIIGILAAVAIPRFGTMIKRAKEGATKGNLGVLRSALSMYYGEQEGYYPQANGTDSFAPLISKGFIDAVPATKGIVGHPDSTSPGVEDETTGSVYVPSHTCDSSAAAKWGYSCQSDRDTAVVYVYCNGNDTKGDTVHSW